MTLSEPIRLLLYITSPSELGPSVFTEISTSLRTITKLHAIDLECETRRGSLGCAVAKQHSSASSTFPGLKSFENLQKSSEQCDLYSITRLQRTRRRRSMEIVHSEDKGSMRVKTYSGEGTLCEGCRKINFTAILRTFSSHEYWETIGGYSEVVHDIRHVQPDSSCALCRCLLSMTIWRTNMYSTLQLFVNSPKCFDKKESPSPGSVILSTVGTDLWPLDSWGKLRFYELSQGLQSRTSARRLFKDTSGPIDWTLVKRWIAQCNSDHARCKLGQLEFPELILIDCEERQLRVRKEATVPYVALSYVWGKGLHEPSDHDNMLKQCPRVIEDSMTVVKSLGMRYLWVDRYCVPQKDAKERHQLIRDMGRIYANSFITLIAAASDGADCGLPGVSVLPRSGNSPLELSLDGRQMVLGPMQTIEHSYYDFQVSKWKSRGWTYQEGLHARRRLIFTRGPLCLECSSGTHFSEDSVSMRGKPEFFPSSNRGSKAYIEECIKDFSIRNFTYDSDALDAFRGTLEMFKHLPRPYHNLFGVVYDPDTGGDQTTSGLVRGLLWTTHQRPYQAGLSSRRRQEFPSWSWLGWRFTSDNTVYYHFAPASPAEVNIAIEFSNGRVLKREDELAETEDYEEAGQQPVNLHISGWSVDFPKGSFSVDEIESCWYIPTSSQLDFDIQLYLQADILVEEILGDSCRAVLMNNDGWWLLVRETAKDGVFERIGILQENTWVDYEHMHKNLDRVRAKNITTIVG